MKMTLLEMVQDIMNDLDFDYVNSISDVPDALQVATVIRTTYFELLTNRVWPHTRTLKQLWGAGPDWPTYMQLPSRVYEIDWIKYNSRDSYQDKDRWRDIKLLDSKEFLDVIMSRNTDNDNITKIIDPSMDYIQLLIRNDRHPEYVTTFDDEWLIFDSYNSNAEGSLHSHNSQTMVVEEPIFVIDDSFVPDMPAKAFPYLLSEAKSVCFNTLKQLPNQKEEQRSRRQRTYLARGKHRVGNYLLDKPADFGRK